VPSLWRRRFRVAIARPRRSPAAPSRTSSMTLIRLRRRRPVTMTASCTITTGPHANWPLSRTLRSVSCFQ
jgi:hypothetical protein